MRPNTVQVNTSCKRVVTGEGSLGTWEGGGGSYITYPRVRFYENWSKLGSITHLGPGKSFILCEACNQGLQQNVLFFPSEICI